MNQTNTNCVSNNSIEKQKNNFKKPNKDLNRYKKAKKQSQWADVWKRLKKNKAGMLGLILLTIIILCAIFADYIAPYGIDDQLLSRRFQPPSKNFLFGTDNFGRDIFSRVIHGSRISLMIGFISVSISAVIGTIIGSFAGFYGGRTDNILMRGIDILLAIPRVLLAISICAALGQGMRNLMIAVAIGSVPGYARIVRASILSVKEQEFIEAARCCGASDLRIVMKHILPNCMAPMIVQATIAVAASILSAAGLSFIGLGVMPPTPEWGAMLADGRAYIRDYWYIVTFPGLAIMTVIFALNLFGDGLRDALDPRLKS